MNFLRDSYNLIFSEWYFTAGFFFIFFSLMYFSGAILTEFLVTKLSRDKKLEPIQHALKPNQKSEEIKHSMVSVLVFSLQAIPLQWLVSKGYFEIGFDNYYDIFWQIPMLFLWNEIHFYAVHRLLHQKWFFKNVHFRHHWSKEPTAFSIYSFHWLEAFLLGTVIFFPLIFFKLNIIAALSLPVMSIILNFIGHSNHDHEWKDHEEEWKHFSFRHSMHHKWSKGNFGFMLPFLDQIFNTNLPKHKN